MKLHTQCVGAHIAGNLLTISNPKIYIIVLNMHSLCLLFFNMLTICGTVNQLYIISTKYMNVFYYSILTIIFHTLCPYDT